MNAYGNANKPINQTVKKKYFKDCQLLSKLVNRNPLNNIIFVSSKKVTKAVHSKIITSIRL